MKEFQILKDRILSNWLISINLNPFQIKNILNIASWIPNFKRNNTDRIKQINIKKKSIERIHLLMMIK